MKYMVQFFVNVFYSHVICRCERKETRCHEIIWISHETPGPLAARGFWPSARPGMAPKQRETALRVGDRASVACRQFGEKYARGRAAAEPRRVQWMSDELRDEGQRESWWRDQVMESKFWWISAKQRSANGGYESWSGSCPALTNAAPVARRVEVESEPESEEEDEASDEEDDDGSEASEDEEEAGEVEDAGDEGNNAPAADADGWTRDDQSANEERRRAGYFVDNEPVWLHRSNLPADASSPTFFFEACKSWLPMPFLSEMADKMQAIGRSKGDVWAGWRVTTDDVLQWIGVWYYFLAFPQNSDRRAYFQGEGSRRFGPRHMIEEWLRRGGNGEKGVRWFENMECVFSMPTHRYNQRGRSILCGASHVGNRSCAFHKVCLRWLASLPRRIYG